MEITLEERADALDLVAGKKTLYLEARQELRDTAQILRHLHRMLRDDFRVKFICDDNSEVCPDCECLHELCRCNDEKRLGRR